MLSAKRVYLKKETPPGMPDGISVS